MPISDLDGKAGALAAQQGGLITAEQAMELGASRSAIASRVRSGRWRRRVGGVYLVGGHPVTTQTRLWEAMLRAGPRQVAVSHESAARKHGVQVDGRAVVVTVPHPRHLRIERASVHQSTDLNFDADTMQIDGLTVTNPPRTIADLAAVLTVRELLDVSTALISARLLQVGQVAVTYERLARPGKRGFDRLATVLDELSGSVGVSESKLERIALDLIRDAELPDPILQHPFPGQCSGAYRVDMAWPDAKVILEIDGRRWHQRQADMARDRERDMAAAAAGWIVVRVMYENLVGDSQKFVAQMRQILARRTKAA